MNRPVRVRFAPSPTGPLHLGGMRTALYNYLFAHKMGGTFVLRIEDTDQNRFVAGAEQYITESLKWAGIEPSEGDLYGGNYGPYRQSDRKHLYKAYADQLIASGHAYIAFDTKEELEAMKLRFATHENPSPSYNYATRSTMQNSLTINTEDVKDRIAKGEPYVVRIKVPLNEEIGFHDLIREHVVFNSSQVDDKVIFKSDGMPTYHLANVVDDYLMEISHVIRGEEWLSSTPIHVLLYRYLGWEEKMPQFAHLPLILKPDGNGKLSKRDGDRLGFPVFPLNWTNPETGEASQGYRERGFEPEAFINFLALLGWNPGTDQEIFSKEVLIQAFSIEKISKSGAKFDFEKTKWFNEQFLRGLSNEALIERVLPFVQQKYPEKASEINFLTQVCALMRDRITYAEEVVTKGYFFFEHPQYSSENLAKIAPSIQQDFVLMLQDLFENNKSGHPELLEIELKALAGEAQVKAGDMMKFLRISIVGELSGPSVPELIILLGAETVNKRLSACLEQLKNKH